MIELGRNYRTRDGHEVRIYAVDGRGDWPVHGAVKNEDGWCHTTWRPDGRWCSDDMPSDLIEVKPRIKRMVAAAAAAVLWAWRGFKATQKVHP